MKSAERVALITGGCAGIGLACARLLLRDGVLVAVGSRRAANAGYREKIAQQLPGALVVEMDVCDTVSVNAGVERVKSALGPIDILVNSAGIGVHQTVCGHSDEDWLAVIETNLNGAFRTIRACLPDMQAAGWGRIVNIASTAASSGKETYAAYCASKAGLLGLGRVVALEGAAHGVNCVAVSPTWVETPMLQQSAATMAAKDGISIDEVLEGIRAGNAQRRMVQADEVAELVAFLCSERSTGLTMEDIQINAGSHW